MKSIVTLLGLCFALSAQAVPVGAGSNASKLQGRLVSTAAPANTNVLAWDSTTSLWTPVAASAGGGDTVSFNAVGSSPSDNGATVSSGAITLQPADATHPGLITTGTQTIAGAKTFSSAIVGNLTGNASGTALSITGVNAVANGGSAKALTLAAGGLLWTDVDSFEVGAAGSSGQIAHSGGTGAPTWSSVDLTSATQVTGVLPAANGGANDPHQLSNCSVGVTVGSSAVTFSLLDGAGGALSATSPCIISFRNATAATGTYAQVTTSAASAGVNTVVGSNGSQLGCPSASVSCTLSVYAINNAGTVELAVMHGGTLDEGTVQTSAVLAGSGGDDADNTLYSTTARASMAVRLLARVRITPAAAFAWTNAVTEISPLTPRTAKMPWYIMAYLTGGSPVFANAAVTEAEVIQASLTMTPVTGSAPAGAVCSTTNTHSTPSMSGTTCGGGSESFGINFNIPSPGVYKLCFQSTWMARLDGGVRIQPFFRLVETGVNDQTTTGVNQATVGGQAMAGSTAGTSEEFGFPLNICGFFDWSGVAAGTNKAVRMFYSQTVTGTPTQVAMYCDNTNNRNCMFLVERVGGY